MFDFGWPTSAGRVDGGPSSEVRLQCSVGDVRIGRHLRQPLGFVGVRVASCSHAEVSPSVIAATRWCVLARSARDPTRRSRNGPQVDAMT